MYTAYVYNENDGLIRRIYSEDVNEVVELALPFMDQGLTVCLLDPDGRELCIEDPR